DHYTLLGLEPGEADTRRIEQRVQERMESLRRYQLTQADQVTEGMNRLAQALVCLTDPAAKKAYDAQLSGRSVKRPKTRAGYRRSRVRDQESDPLEPSGSQASPRWLLLAWSVWLSIGLAGLVAVVINFRDIQESYFEVTKTTKEAKK